MEDPEIESGMDNETNQFNTIEMLHGFLLEMNVFFYVSMFHCQVCLFGGYKPIEN